MVPAPRRPYYGYLVLALGVGVNLVAPLAIGNDGLVRFEAIDQLLCEGSFHPTKYSLYGPLAAAPLWLLGEAIGQPTEAVWVFNRLVFLAGLAALWGTLRSVLPEPERMRFTALLLFGSMFPWHVMSFFAEVFQVVGVGLGLALIVTRRGSAAVLGWGLAVWGTANVPASAVGLVLAAVTLCWHRRRLRYLLLPAAAAVLIVIENWVRRGHPLATGYAGEAGYGSVLPYSGQPGFSYPLFFGVLAVLFSFGKGLVFFTPGLFARYPEADAHTPSERAAEGRLVYRLWVAVVVGLVLVYARWWAWYGGAVWGPRFFLFACLPAALVLARWIGRASDNSLAANVLLLLALALSCWVGANGIVYQEYDHDQFRENNFALEHLTWYVPECSVLWRPFVVDKPLNWEERGYLAAFAVGFAYLAAPVARVAARQLGSWLRNTWQLARSGPDWRF